MGYNANSADQVQPLLNAASDQGMSFFMQNTVK